MLKRLLVLWQVEVPKYRADCDDTMAATQAKLDEVTEVCNQSVGPCSKSVLPEIVELRTFLPINIHCSLAMEHHAGTLPLFCSPHLCLSAYPHIVSASSLLV